HTVRVHFHISERSGHLQHSHLASIILASKRLSRQVNHSITEMLHGILNMLIMHSLIGQQKIQSRRLTHVSMQGLHRLLNSRKRRATNNITQTVHHERTSAQRRNILGKLLRQEIRGTNIPVNHPCRFLPLHPETINEPHLPRIEISFKTPAIQIHLCHNILPRTASREIYSRPTIKQPSIHDLLNASIHSRICLAQEEDDATRGKSAHRLIECRYSARKILQFLYLSLSLLSLVFHCETLLVDGVGLPLNPLFHYPGTVGYWNRPRNNLFEARVSGSGAFSVENGGAYHRDQHFLHRSVRSE